MILNDFNPSLPRPTRAKIALPRYRSLAAVILLLGSGMMAAQIGPTPAERAEQLRQAGVAQATSGHIDEAIASFKRGLEIVPQDPKLLDAAGAAYSLKGDLETARQYFVESLTLAPDAVSTKQNLGIALFSLGRYEEAAKHFADLYQTAGKPRDVASLFLGLIAQRQSRCKEAASLMEASGGLLFQYPDALLSYSECEYEIGETKHAKEALTAFERFPGNSSAQLRQAADLKARLGINSNVKARGRQSSSQRRQ